MSQNVTSTWIKDIYFMDDVADSVVNLCLSTACLYLRHIHVPVIQWDIHVHGSNSVFDKLNLLSSKTKGQET